MRFAVAALAAFAIGLTFAGPAIADDFQRETFDDTGFVAIFNASSLVK